MRAATPPTAVDPFGILARIVRVVAGMAVMAGFLSGAMAGPEIPDLSASKLSARLAGQEGRIQKFIRTMETALVSGNLAEAEALVDRDSLLGRATANLGIPEEESLRQVFEDSTRRAWDERGVLRDYSNTRFRFLRVRTLGGRPGLLFRSSARQGGMNYALFTLNETADGELRVSDIFVVGLNEFLSSTLRRTYKNVAAGFMKELGDDVPGVNKSYVQNIQKVASVSRDLQAGNYEAALIALKQLPAEVQKERSVLLMRLEAAEHISIDERDGAYTTWLESYPDEMELPLKFADFYVSHRRWDDAERVLRGLIEKLGSDSIIKTELGTVLFRKTHDQLWSGPAASLSAR